MESISYITVRYAETDQMGIAHHSNYPVWYEVARTDLIKQLGLTYSEMESSGILTPLVELHCRYLLPARYEDQLEVHARVASVSSVKIEFSYEIYKKGEKKPINTGSTVHAMVGKDLKPFHIKRRLPELYDKLLHSVN